MLSITFIGKENQTNTLIKESLESNFAATVIFAEPATAFQDPSKLKEKPSHIIIIDLNTSYGLGNAPDNIAKINSELSSIPILVLHQHENNTLIKPIISSGAKGVISSTPSEKELSRAIHELRNGNSFYPFTD